MKKIHDYQKRAKVIRKWRKLLSMLMVLALLLGMDMPAASVRAAERVENTGTMGVGKLVTWTYDEGNQTLVLSGGGEEGEDISEDGSLYEFLNYRTVKMISFRDCKLKGKVDDLCASLSNLEIVDFRGFDTSAVTSMNGMFRGCSSLKSLDLSGFDTNNVTDMSGMFQNCYRLKSLDLSSFQTTSVMNMSSMFFGCSKLEELDLSSFEISGNVTDMFKGCGRLNKLAAPKDMGSRTVELPQTFYEQGEPSNTCQMLSYSANEKTLLRVRPTEGTLGNAGNLTWTYDAAEQTLTLSSKVESGVPVADEIREEEWGTDSVLERFSGYDIRKVVFSECKLEGVMYHVFAGMDALEEIDCSGLDTGEVTNMEYLFVGCSSLQKITFGEKFTTAKVKSMYGMFSGCESLEELDLSLFDTSLLDWEGSQEMFSRCYKLAELKTPGTIGSNAIPLFNPFTDGNGRYEELTGALAGKTLTRVVPEVYATDLTWEKGLFKFKIHGETDPEDRFYIDFFCEPDEDANEVSGWGGGAAVGALEAMKQADGYYYYDYTSNIYNSGKYYYALQLSIGGEEGIWYRSEDLIYRRPVEKVALPEVTPGETLGTLKIRTVEHSQNYNFSLFRPGDEMNCGGGVITTAKLDDWGYACWADETHTQIYLDWSNPENNREAGEYYWRVRAYSDDVESYAHSDCISSQTFVYDGKPTGADENGKYYTPTNPRWGGNWNAYFECPGARESGSCIEVYKDGEEEPYYVYENRYGGLGSGIARFMMSDHIKEDGSYRFRVKLLPRHDNTTNSESEWSGLSDARNYVKPDKSIGTTMPRWDSTRPGVILFDKVEGAREYTVYCYKVQEDGSLDGVSNWCDADVTEYDWSSYIAEEGEGKYKVRVVPLSGNIDKYYNVAGADCPLSEEYEYDAGSVEPVDPGEKTYQVTYDYRENGTNNTIDVEEGSKLEEPVVNDLKGLVFEGWYKDSGFDTKWNFDTDTVTENITLYAKWTSVPTFEVSFEMQGHGDAIAKKEVNQNAKIARPVVAEVLGYVLEGWYREEAYTTEWNFDEDVVTENITLYAKWKQVDTFKVTYDLQGHGEAIEEKTVNVGTKLTAPTAPTEEGFTFGGWYKEKECTTEWKFDTDTVTVDTTLYAKWTEAAPVIVTYTVTFNLQGHGEAITPITVQAGGKVAEPTPVPTATGFVFGGWYKEKECATAWDFANDTVAADITLYAKWTEEKKTENKNTVTPEDVDDSSYKKEERIQLSTIGAAIGTIKPKVYDGNAYMPTVKVTATVDGKNAVLIEGIDYRVLYKDNVNAGTGKVIVKGNGIYDGEISADLVISKKPMSKLKVAAGGMGLNSTAEPPIYVYDGNKQLTLGVDYKLDGISGLTSSAGKKDVTVSATESSNYSGNCKTKVIVYATEKVLNDSDVTLEYTSKDYTGKALKPNVTVKFDGKELDKKSFSVKYTNNKEAGTAYVTVTGKKDYAGCVVKTFEIKPVAKSFELKKAINPVTYNGKYQKPKATVTVDGKALKAGKDYLLFYSNNLHATKEGGSKAKVTVKGLGNYANTVDKTFDFTINPQKINKVSVKGTKEKLEVSYLKRALLKDIDYTVEPGEEARGKIALTITGKGDFTGSVVKKVKVQ